MHGLHLPRLCEDTLDPKGCSNVAISVRQHVANELIALLAPSHMISNMLCPHRKHLQF